MHQFYVFNAPHNVPLSRRYTLQIHSRNTPVLSRKYDRNSRVFAPQMRRKRIANCPFSDRVLPTFCPQFTRFLSVFRPQFAHKSARKHAYLTPQTCPLCATKALQTHPFNIANIPERRRKTPVLRRKSTHKHACLTRKNDLQLTVLSERSPTKIFALELIVNISCGQSVASRLIRNR